MLATGKQEGMSVRELSPLLGISGANHYYRRQEPGPQRKRIEAHVVKYHRENPAAGQPDMAADTRNQLGEPCGRAMIRSIQRRRQLYSPSPGPTCRTKPSATAEAAPNLIADLRIDQPGPVWCSDTSHLTIGDNRTVYFVAFMDLYSRYIVGWRLSNTHDRWLCCQALADALTLHPAPTILHRDQGCQYTSRDFRNLLAGNRIAQSMTAKGYHDNLHMERFFGTLKNQRVRIHNWPDIRQAEQDIGRWVGFYNQRRPHTACGTKPPASLYNIALRPDDCLLAEKLSAAGLSQLVPTSA